MALVALNALVAVAVVVYAAPAAWIGGWLAARGPWRVVHAEGTLWRGTASVGIEDRGVIRLLPGRVAWRFMPDGLIAGRVALSLTHPAVDNRVAVAVAGDGVTVGPATMRLPAAVLAAFGAPFNTVRPGGDLRMTWSALRFERGALHGHVEVDWMEARSGLSPVAPLGTYRLSVDGGSANADVELVTLSGPLQLAGRGTVDRQRVRFTGSADAAPEFRPGLGALLGVLGRRAGDKAVFDWEIAW